MSNQARICDLFIVIFFKVANNFKKCITPFLWFWTTYLCTACFSVIGSWDFLVGSKIVTADVMIHCIRSMKIMD